MKAFLLEVIELLRSSVLLQSFITAVLVCVAAVLWIKGVALPDSLSTALYIVLGFFFGAKVQHAAERGLRR